MTTVMPMIAVDDLEAASDFYQNTLGFQQTMTMKMPDGSPMMIMVMFSEDSGIMFNQADPHGPVPNALNPDGLALYISTADVDAYHDELAAKDGVQIVQELTDQFWGDRNFMVMDPWGLQLWFHQTTGNVSAPPEGFEVDMVEFSG